MSSRRQSGASPKDRCLAYLYSAETEEELKLVGVDDSGNISYGQNTLSVRLFGIADSRITVGHLASQKKPAPAKTAEPESDPFEASDEDIAF